MKPIRILDWFTIEESLGGYYGDSIYVRIHQSGKTFWLRGADAEDGAVDVFTERTAKKVYEQLKNDGAVETEDGHYIVLTPSFLTKWYEN